MGGSLCGQAKPGGVSGDREPRALNLQKAIPRMAPSPTPELP